MCFYTYLIILTSIVLFTLMVMLTEVFLEDDNEVSCTLDGAQWRFKTCGVRFLISFMHVFTTMQCAAMTRSIFIKSLKQAKATI